MLYDCGGSGCGFQPCICDQPETREEFLTRRVTELGAYIDNLRARIAELEAERAWRPIAEWDESDGAVLWTRFPIDEPPYMGTPNDLGHTVELHTQDGPEPRIAARCTIGGWPGYHTHWMRVALPDEPPPAPEVPDVE